MAKITAVQEVAVAELVPYERNAKMHSPDQVEKIAASIEEFGFISPCLIDKDKNIIAGHGRVAAAQALGLKKVPCVYVEGLSEEQRRAYILADNKLTELGGWDMGIVNDELSDLSDLDFDVSLTGFDFVTNESWFDSRKRYDNDAKDTQDEEYQDFVEKFEPKRTTDDCYTPDNIYEAVADYVSEHYGKDKKKFVRPFYPGGDYQNEKYPAGRVVVDNPPFSILSEIIRFYCEHGIEFFLFAPTVTAFSGAAGMCCAIPVGAQVVYENGANVNTSFITNLENARFRSCPELYKTISAANEINRRAMSKELPKYTYPNEVVTAAMVQRYSKYGIEFQVGKDESAPIAELDSQKGTGKAIYGGGYLISEAAAAEKAAAEKAAAEKAAAEKAAATVWELSDREREIVRGLGK